ncbi:M48 family metallopeptidase, partial [Odoribacter laneus]|uniref:M48 family metallopeptidase n=1 Tax=Odoribacter laneus TaxID=626933 RepID=UPI003AF65877
DLLKENKLSTDAKNTARIKNIGKKIAQAVETYLKSQGMESRIEGFNWEFNLVQSKEMNAWCMPGGKVVFYEGILPVCKTDAGIAVVMGHEIAHAIARHGNERMSQQMLVQAGSVAAAYALKNKPETTQTVLGAAIGLGANYGLVLPFSRKHESEADRLGLIFMAIAGYDPHEAVDFWTRMAAASSGQKVPEFASTHPSDSRRIADLKAEMPEAMKYYKK